MKYKPRIIRLTIIFFIVAPMKIFGLYYKPLFISFTLNFNMTNLLNFIINVVSGKTMENVSHSNIKLVTIKARKKYLVSEPNYHRAKLFPINF